MITNEHVVAMMKAAISETEDIPLFVSKKLFQLGFSVVPNARYRSGLSSWSVMRYGESR